MAKSATKSPPVVDPFASAARKAPASSAAAAADFISPKDVVAHTGAAYSAADMKTAINDFCEGKQKEDEGKAMQGASRPVILDIGRTLFAQSYLLKGTRPSSPTFSTDASGRGKMLKVIFSDSVNKLDENSFATLAGIIGEEKAEEVTVKRDDFSLNPELLHETVDVMIDGKQIQMRVMDAIAKALQGVFAPSPHILGSLFQVTPVFTTSKGLIDRAIELAAPDKSPASAIRVAEFLVAGRFTTQLKPGNLAAK